MARNVARQREPTRICFEPFTLDLDTRELLCDGAAIRLAPKAFELLMVLAVERPKALSKATLQERLWPDTFVAEANLANLVAEIRQALNDQRRAPRFIRTVHGFGYAFCGEAIDDTAPSKASDRPVCWIEWDQRRFPLAVGEHLIGRDADVDVRLDATTVSRRHARLVVTLASTTLEDFGSKNGTFRGGERVTSPIQLIDGDAIGIGSLLLTFHQSTAASTETQTRLPS